MTLLFTNRANVVKMALNLLIKVLYFSRFTPSIIQTTLKGSDTHAFQYGVKNLGKHFRIDMENLYMYLNPILNLSSTIKQKRLRSNYQSSNCEF